MATKRLRNSGPWVIISGAKHKLILLELLDNELAFQRDELKEVVKEKTKKQIRGKIMVLSRLRTLMLRGMPKNNPPEC